MTDIREQVFRVKVANQVFRVTLPVASNIGPQGPQGPQGDPGASGAVITTWKGMWVSGAYDAGDIVQHQGSAWLAVASVDGEEPGVAGVWELFAAGGQDGADGADGAAGAPGAPGSDGADGADGNFINTWKGAWVSGEYDEGDLVHHDGSAWIAVDAIDGEEPGVDPEWELVAQKGDQGPHGDPGTFVSSWQGAWASGVYSAGDLVGHLGSTWVATTAINGEEPGTDPEWELVAEKGDQGDQGPAGNTGPGLAGGGAQGQILVKQSATDFDTAWENHRAGLVFVFGDGVTEIRDGASDADMVDVEVPYDMRITNWTVVCTVPSGGGSIEFDVWACDLTDHPAEDTDTVVGAGEEPELASETYNSASGLAWDLNAGQIVRVVVVESSVTDVKQVTLTLTGVRRT